jgi:hypothetical protein
MPLTTPTSDTSTSSSISTSTVSATTTNIKDTAIVPVQAQDFPSAKILSQVTNEVKWGKHQPIEIRDFGLWVHIVVIQTMIGVDVDKTKNVVRSYVFDIRPDGNIQYHETRYLKEDGGTTDCPPTGYPPELLDKLPKQFSLESVATAVDLMNQYIKP